MASSLPVDLCIFLSFVGANGFTEEGCFYLAGCRLAVRHKVSGSERALFPHVTILRYDASASPSCTSMRTVNLRSD